VHDDDDLADLGAPSQVDCGCEVRESIGGWAVGGSLGPDKHDRPGEVLEQEAQGCGREGESVGAMGDDHTAGPLGERRRHVIRQDEPVGR
jgi:hypothetical protein